MDQSEGGIPATQLRWLGINDWRRWFYVERGLLPQCPVWPVTVVVSDVLGQDSFELPVAEDHHLIEALTADGADEALGEGVCPGSPDRCAE